MCLDTDDFELGPVGVERLLWYRWPSSMIYLMNPVQTWWLSIAICILNYQKVIFGYTWGYVFTSPTHVFLMPWASQGLTLGRSAAGWIPSPFSDSTLQGLRSGMINGDSWFQLIVLIIQISLDTCLSWFRSCPLFQYTYTFVTLHGCSIQTFRTSLRLLGVSVHITGNTFLSGLLRPIDVSFPTLDVVGPSL